MENKLNTVYVKEERNFLLCNSSLFIMQNFYFYQSIIALQCVSIHCKVDQLQVYRCACVLSHDQLFAIPWAGLLCLWDFSGKNTGASHHFLLQEINSIYMSILICHFIHPFSPLHLHTFVLYIYVSISAQEISLTSTFFGFHIYALIYSICSSLSYFTVYDSLQVHPHRS